MPSSVLSRLRRPVRRRTTPEIPTEPQCLEQAAPAHQQLPIDRKILQDPSSFIVEDAAPLGLTPSTRLPSANGSNNPRSRSHPRATPSEPAPGRGALLPDTFIDISPPTPSGPAIGRTSKVASGGEWSTFGRKRNNRYLDVDGHSERASLDDHKSSQSPSLKHVSTDSALSTYTLSRLTNPFRARDSTHERHSTHSAKSARPDIDNKRPSPTNTLSSEPHPQTPQKSHSYTAPHGASHTASSAMNPTTPANQENASDSPHTFGNPTPPENPVDLSVACPSPKPPLPLLNHPELTAALSARRKSTPTGQTDLTVLRDRLHTLPTPRRSPRKDDLFTSFSLRLGRSIYRSSLPQATEVMAEQQENGSPDASAARRRARTMSGDVQGRRTSADWSAHEATVGVNSHANRAWPAEVSRELLRLCGHETPRRGPDTVSGSLLAPLSDQSPSLLLPFPRPSRPPPPPTASATLSDRREVTPVRPRSLQFSLRSPRGSDQPLIRPPMADVKRSLSVIEARNTPKNDASGGASSELTDPVPTFSKAPQTLTPFSALTRSRSLFSGRVPDTKSPMSSSLQAEPSTPTPAPRHLSDKSRGKRKAEDNLDLTPPEQKKEGQHTTFLLPTEARSQRISNSSHAPSSYHRKRARLSSVSPFATPVQSRASSVHETPRSASRDHHFSSLSSSTGGRIASPRTPSRAASNRSRQPHTPSTTKRHERHQSMSQMSIPISAIVSPHAPSISKSAKFHMRDPRKPPRKRGDTPWGLRFTTEDEAGSPIQAWCFFLGFLLFPVWWIAGLLLRVPRTRFAGDVDTEKGVTIDDPQIEHDARVWRFRCRILAVVSLFTYVPFIVLVSIFAPR